MKLEFAINNSVDPAARYLTWSPSPLRLRLLDADPTGGPIRVTLTESAAPGGGSIRFSTGPTTAATATLAVDVPSTGASVTVFVRGKYGSPSSADGDVSVVATDAAGQQVAKVPVMVRIRKNANSLTVPERDRFVSAFAKLNNRGSGRFRDFRDMHVAGPASQQAHGGPGFLPWHRAYTLDLERELQAIDPSVALPYWRFDQKAPFVFTRDFMGVPDPLGTVQFSPSNPLQFWSTDGAGGVNRTPRAVDPAVSASPAVATEKATLDLGVDYVDFIGMANNPHGLAHTSYFGGYISSIPTAAKDPLFFLLHCNVDRLWAKWQQKNGRFDASSSPSYMMRPGGQQFLVGHNLGDSMWPWNGLTTPPRPQTAPGGFLADSPCVSAPGPSPLVRDMLDYGGTVNALAALGFAYDDVQ